MTRLTASLKKQIVKNAVEQSTAHNDLIELRKAGTELAHSIRIFEIGGLDEHARILEAAEAFETAVPARYRERRVVEACQRLCVTFNNDNWLTFNFTEKQLMSQHPIRLEDDHPHVQEVRDYAKDLLRLVTKKDDIERQVEASLTGITTVAKLLKVWPEAKVLLPDDIDAPSSSLPAVQVDTLNQLIGLPKND